MINAQHAHIYRIHTLHFIFGEIFFLKILSIPPLTPVTMVTPNGMKSQQKSAKIMRPVAYQAR
jgi:hypothetical protein